MISGLYLLTIGMVKDDSSPGQGVNVWSDSSPVAIAAQGWLEIIHNDQENIGSGLALTHKEQ